MNFISWKIGNITLNLTEHGMTWSTMGRISPMGHEILFPVGGGASLSEIDDVKTLELKIDSVEIVTGDDVTIPNSSDMQEWDATECMCFAVFGKRGRIIPISESYSSSDFEDLLKTAEPDPNDMSF